MGAQKGLELLSVEDEAAIQIARSPPSTSRVARFP